MGFDYVLVILYRPLLTRLDVYKILFLVVIAIVSTIPWDSYLIRNKIWTYPANAIVGPKLFDIPAEEVFFFAVQTYTTSLLYLLLSKPVFFPVYLRSGQEHYDALNEKSLSWRCYQRAGQVALVLGCSVGIQLVTTRGCGTYLGLIVVWACPFLLLLWSLAYQLILGIPPSCVLWPIVAPTFYLWIVDTLALRRGTWVIEPGTKLGFHLWPGLEIEEALFFLATNTLIVFGLIAFDNALAVLHTCWQSFPTVSALPSPSVLVRALLKRASTYDEGYLCALREATKRLRLKSQSFYLASGAFQGRLRADLILLYSFCRMADDFIDNAASTEEARDWIHKLRRYLDLSYNHVAGGQSLQSYIEANFPIEVHSTLKYLPVHHLSKEPLDSMISGFEIDLAFGFVAGQPVRYPIKGVSDLDLYAERVAGTIAHLVLELVFLHLPNDATADARRSLIRAGSRMGVALQYVNMSRDIAVDARMHRVYIPLGWISAQGLTPFDIIEKPHGARVEELRLRMLNRAFKIYAEARGAIEELPDGARGPMRVAVESYMEIGRVMKDGGYTMREGRASVPRWRRAMVAWKSLRDRSE